MRLQVLSYETVSGCTEVCERLVHTRSRVETTEFVGLEF